MAQNLFKIIFSNAHGASKKKQELRAFLTENDVDAALLPETFKPCHTYNTPNYTTHWTDRLHKHGGGTAILVRKNINHDFLDTHITNMESTSVRVHSNRGPITLYAAYSPRNSDIDEIDLDAAFCTQQATILAGDLNAKHHNWNSKTSNSKGRQVKIITGRKLITINASTDDTHIHASTGTSDVLDIAIRNLIATYHIETINDLSSDHLPVLMTLDLRGNSTPSIIHTTNWLTYKIYTYARSTYTTRKTSKQW